MKLYGVVYKGMRLDDFRIFEYVSHVCANNKEEALDIFRYSEWRSNSDRVISLASIKIVKVVDYGSVRKLLEEAQK